MCCKNCDCITCRLKRIKEAKVSREILELALATTEWQRDDYKKDAIKLSRHL